MSNPIVAKIKEIEKNRESKAILYITGERPPAELATGVGIDVLPSFEATLRSFGVSVKKISLIICTSGGDTGTPWPLVNYIRECCEEFEVIVLNKSLSAGTLIAIGADKIVMSKFAHLSPVDPAKHYMDGNGNRRKLEIEDTIGYIDFVKNKAGITEQSALSEMMLKLTGEVDPTQLGSVNRTHALIRSVAKNLLGLHKEPLETRDCEDIIEHLTEKLYAHGHLINRREARRIGFSRLVEDASDTLDTLLEELSVEIEKVLKQNKPFVPAEELAGATEPKKVVVPRALIYSTAKRYQLNSHFQLVPQGTTPQNVNVVEMQTAWEAV